MPLQIASAADFAPARPVSPQRLAAVFMVICEAAVIAQPSRGWIFALGLMSMALLSILLASRRRLLEVPFLWLVIAITVVFAFKYSLLPHPFPLDATYINSELSHEIANGLIAVQIGVLCHARFAEQIPSTFLSLGGLAVVFGNNARVHGANREFSLLLTVLFLLSLGIVAMTTRRRVRGPGDPWRLVILGGVVLVFGTAATVSSRLLRHYERDLESLVLQYLAGADGESAHRSGFSGAGTLSQIGTWKTTDENRVRVRVTSPTAPGYLRGRVLDTYMPTIGRWSPTVEAEPVGMGAPLNVVRPPFPGNFFRLQPSSATEWRSMEFRIDEDNHAATFLPLDAAFVYIDEATISVDEHTAVLRRRATPAPYAAFVPAEFQDQPISETVRRAGLRLDPETDPRIAAIAEELFRDCTTTREKINAVVRHLTRNFRYKLGIEIPPHQDPVAHFLTNRAPAHCEYFASAAALLLKFGGVPARYVTGYVAVERNELGGVWIARSRDAHAWVEAYDEAQGRWQIVEATPGDGVPSQRGSAPSDEFLGGIWQSLLELKDLYQEQGLLAVVRRILLMPAVQVLLLGAAAIWWLQRRKPKAAEGSADDIDAERTEWDLRDWHKLLQRMDGAMARVGLPRDSGETLLDFAERIRRSVDPAHRDRLADWYRTYAEARYQPEHAGPPTGLATLPDLKGLARARPAAPVSETPPPTSSSVPGPAGSADRPA